MYEQDQIKLPEQTFLSAEEEISLSKVIQTSKKEQEKENAIVKMFESNLRLVLNMAHRYNRSSSMPVEELYNAGRVGLLKAIHRYRPEKFHTRFTTYATPWIQSYIRDALYSNSAVKIPVNIINGAYRKRKIQNDDSEISENEIQEKLQLTDIQMDKVNKANISVLNLDAPMSESHSDGHSATSVSECVADENAAIPGHYNFTDDRYDCMLEALYELDEMSRDIVISQMASDNRVTLRELGRKYRMSGEGIRKVKLKAMDHLKQKIMYKMNQKEFSED